MIKKEMVNKILFRRCIMDSPFRRLRNSIKFSQRLKHLNLDALSVHAHFPFFESAKSVIIEPLHFDRRNRMKVHEYQAKEI